MIEKVYQHTFPSAMEEFKVRIADNIEKLLGVIRVRIPLGVPTALIAKAVFLLHIIYRKGGTVFYAVPPYIIPF